MYTTNETEEVSPTPITLECLNEDCPGHLTVPVASGLHRFTPCDSCPWSYDVRVWARTDGCAVLTVVANYAPGSSASPERGC